jgi:hypothetical protein
MEWPGATRSVTMGSASFVYLMREQRWPPAPTAKLPNLLQRWRSPCFVLFARQMNEHERPDIKGAVP